MKALLGIFAILLYVQLVVSQMNPPTEIDVNDINKIRQIGAKEMNITNMNKLKWDEGLADKAFGFPTDCERWKHSSDYRVWPIGGAYLTIDRNSIGLKEFFADYERDLKVDTYQGDIRALLNKHKASLDRLGQDPTIIFGGLESYHPLQTKIGCAVNQCTGEKDGTRYSLKGLCLLGPKGTIQVADVGFAGFPTPAIRAGPERSLGTGTRKSIAPITARSVVTDTWTEWETDSATGNLALGLIGAFVALFLL